MSIGPDIKEVIEELGDTFTVLQSGSFVAGGKCFTEMNTQSSKPFVREHHLDAVFSYDSTLESGDVIYISVYDAYFLVMNITPENFEDQKVENNSIIYKCNLNGSSKVLRPVETKVGYQSVVSWQTIEENFYGLITNRIYGSEIDQESIVGQAEVWRLALYLSKDIDIRPLDRFVVSGVTEYYKVETIESYYFPGVNVILLTEDTRPVHLEDEY